MSDFNWQLIPSFLAAHQHGSLLAAARALGISQPTVGRHVTQLEAQLGTPLFERTGRGLVPTPAALRLAEAARAMEAGAQTLMRGAQQAQATLAGTAQGTLVAVLSDLPMPAMPVWLVVHREIRTSRRIREVVDFLAREWPPML
ncbi:MAG: LysR family transcriptional regulator [Hydrogenophaga sp.]|uniref:LysR family transcriptional regulator n=1 Tax=Hydrogenophaga sp. TaxID=1904254 RepID=UPI00271D92DA|nr:LysR family transcriptional regulator [Hydrogenophaga sp.]MDO9252139.1 LysR family transcriptional regulator [Hydrogenophaga sp.]MDP2408460.1 LysR family transcriptional regulator [Hydrogenophaga sp.]MDZ4176618.1 LysR family transcriptional regulator [Hydrogenophaga sp.]